MFKDILVPDINADSERGPMAAALALAEAFQAHVEMVVTVDVPQPMPGQWAGISNEVYTRLHREARDRAQARADALRAKFAQAAAPVEVRITDAGALYPQNAATMQARYADLAVMASVPRDSPEAGLAHDYFHDLLMHAGRPVLVVPADATLRLPLKRAIVAWKPTREAARAVHDALPLLRRVEAVDVLVVDPKVGESAHGEQPGADIAAHLARHGLKVEVKVRTSMNFSTAYAILDEARATGADLIVAGGYGRSRMREFLLGGVTRELLQSTHLPVLFAH